MSRPSSSGTSTNPAITQTSTRDVSTKKKTRRSSLVIPKSPRNSSNRLWVQEQQRRQFLHHLTQWSINHDACPHFHGKISLTPQSSWRREDFELGKSVNCILTDTSFTDSRQKIVIRLFPPQESFKRRDRDTLQDKRRDSMDPFGPERAKSEYKENADWDCSLEQRSEALTQQGHYKLVVRCGAGWMSAREYFSKLYFAHLEARRMQPSLDDSLMNRSRALGPIPPEKESVTIRPLFTYFCRLPPELQDMIFTTAAGLSRLYNLCSDEYGIPKVAKNLNRSAISLSTLFQISRRINEHMIPHIYHSTDFNFGLTGFTNFLWQSGPSSRREISRLTFHFGKLALLHCIRWLAPDPVFALLEPPVATNPRSLQYFWRCQIQDLVQTLDLLTLTINIKNIPQADLPMVVAAMKSAFGSIERIHFIETGKDGESHPVEIDDERLECLKMKKSWRENCDMFYRKHRRHSFFMKYELLKGGAKLLHDTIAGEEDFFDAPFSPLVPKEEYPKWT